MTLDDMMAFVRLHADADTSDAPSSSLTVYARMAYNDILARRVGWPHLQVNYTLTTVANQYNYPLSGLSVTDMDVVTAVVDNVSRPSRRLIAITRSDADFMYAGPTFNTSANAQHYLVENDTIVLFPTPSAVKTYVVRGYRAASAWPNGGGSEPNLPRVFDEAICWFMLSQYFLSQEDTTLAGVYMGEYQQQVERWVKSETSKTMVANPNIMGGAGQASPSWLRSVRGGLE